MKATLTYHKLPDILGDVSNRVAVLKIFVKLLIMEIIEIQLCVNAFTFYMLWGIQTFQSRPVENPEEEEEDWEVAEGELDAEADDVLLKNHEENPPKFDGELAPEVLEVVG